MKIQRFAVFAGDDYYPSGGWGDFCGSFESLEAAIAALSKLQGTDWGHVIDLETGEEVHSK